MNYPKYTTYALVLSVIALTVLVPGGPIETRDFSHLFPSVAFGFNTFLTILVLFSVASIYFMIKRQKWAYQAAGIMGFAYVLVYLLDLGKIFPVSTDAMPPALFSIEIVGTILGFVLMWLSYKTISVTDESFWRGTFKLSKVAIVTGIVLLLIGAFVLYFATASVLEL